MKEIDQAMKVIEDNTYGDAEGLRLIREQLELVAKAARREALNKAADEIAEVSGLCQCGCERKVRELAEGTT